MTPLVKHRDLGGFPGWRRRVRSGTACQRVEGGGRAATALRTLPEEYYE
jgi:hypothetical protein